MAQSQLETDLDHAIASRGPGTARQQASVQAGELERWTASCTVSALTCSGSLPSLAEPQPSWLPRADSSGWWSAILLAASTSLCSSTG